MKNNSIQIDNIINSVLSGRSLTEAIDDQSVDKDMAYKEIKKNFEEFLDGLKAFNKAIKLIYDNYDEETYINSYLRADGCPFKNLASPAIDCERWVKTILANLKEGK